MKQSLQLLLFFLVTAVFRPGYADVQVIVPQGELSSRLPIPIQLKSAKNYAGPLQMEISGSQGVYLSMASSDASLLTSISTRFRGADREIVVKTQQNNEPTSVKKIYLNLKDLAVVPEDLREAEFGSGSAKQMLIKGGKNAVGTLRKGTFLTSDRFSVLVLNASSKASYIELLQVEFTKGGQKTVFSMNGSPFWFEPFILFEGSFDDARVLRVQTKD
jgi:hypothetical protein